MPSSPAAIPIVFCITDLDPGGAERALVQLVTRLNRQRFNPHVICLSSGGTLVSSLENAGVPVTCLGACRWWDLQIVLRLTARLQQLQPAILQTFLFHANIAGRLAAWRCGTPHVVSGIRVAERRRNMHLRLDRWTESLVDRHVCVSHAVADYAREQGRLTPQKLRVIPNGVDYARFADAIPLDLSKWNITPDDNVWVTVGRLDLQKGPWELLAAAESMHRWRPAFRLLWAGDGPLRAEMQRWIDARGLQACIQLMGWQNDIPGLLKAARGFVLASRWEGMPNVVLEAMAAGLPVISTRAEGVSEIITHGQTGWLVEHPDELVDCWKQVLADPTAALQTAIAGQQHVRDHFTWEAMAEQYMALYEELLASQPPATGTSGSADAFSR